MESIPEMISPTQAVLLIIAAAIIVINRGLIFRRHRSWRCNYEGTVTHIVDGDTIKVAINGTIETVRYIGVNAPERGEDGYEDAILTNRRLVDGRRVRMEADKQDTDKYGRKLRYVWVGRKFVNRELYQQGVARIMAIKPNTKRIGEIER
jgi:endonuclease YncB( thermonuclease family)